MDLKPSITIDDLFADMKKSFAKYEKKQKQKQKLRKEASCNTSSAPQVQVQEEQPNNSKSLTTPHLPRRQCQKIYSPCCLETVPLLPLPHRCQKTKKIFLSVNDAEGRTSPVQ